MIIALKIMIQFGRDKVSDVIQLDEKVIDYWNKRGCDVSPSGDMILLNGQPKFRDISKHIIGEMSDEEYQDYRKAIKKRHRHKYLSMRKRERLKFKARHTDKNFTDIVASRVDQINNDLNDLIQDHEKKLFKQREKYFTKFDFINEDLLKICLKHDVSIEQLKAKSRKQRFAIPRREAYSLLKEKYGLSYPRIGQILGGRDHTTVLHGYRKFKAEHEVSK